MSGAGTGVELSSRALNTGRGWSCKALRERVLPGFPDQGRTDRRTYGVDRQNHSAVVEIIAPPNVAQLAI